MKSAIFILIALVIALGSFLGYGYKRYQALVIQSTNTEQDLKQQLVAERETRDYLLQKLSGEASRNDALNEQLGDITSTVGTLTKLTQTDKELLQKYSKVYFLNENYVPSGLATVPSDLVSDKQRGQQFHAEALSFLQNMMRDAKSNDTPILIISAYRSFDEQNSLKKSYKVTYGSGANAFSADQGYSEHQLGTALDLTTVKLGANFEQFADTEAYEWLLENAYKYGFVLSYPKNNSYYQFEPWHWRFVGTSLAKRLHNEGENFYDLDQRTIDNYLINIFD